ncbi:hypothetical protein [Vagococcus fluvialis]|uniref:hypothetical protein n=1 Tax=Vagococcus fluvialis TaxID=2738 RepID=UPI001D09BC45|nr:hypothetical protein [Vagococcus fluvialis]UDM70660.1 hypothetical protein K5L00_11085 [Vagococcus fluvialis]UDM78079.1 hypothetical protein K5K98_06620 [Vagococcus fluvialis]UDM82348.1 hypothetical protein K5K96_13560 [Vagococcus fluvialis]
MTIETKVLKLLSSDKYLVKLLESLRTAKTDVSSIWKHEIPENYRKKEYAPFIRINPIYEADTQYADDEAMSEEQRVQISFWTAKDLDSEKIIKEIDRILKNNNFTRYTANENPRYKDSDIDLLINHRKYRFFDWKK